MAITVQAYLTTDGANPFARWFAALNVQAALKVRTAIAWMEGGNLSNAKNVGAGVFENRIDFGPGYRVYFGRDGRELIILLGGGTKTRQRNDISAARGFWADYKARKRREK